MSDRIVINQVFEPPLKMTYELCREMTKCIESKGFVFSEKHNIYLDSWGKSLEDLWASHSRKPDPSKRDFPMSILLIYENCTSPEETKLSVSILMGAFTTDVIWITYYCSDCFLERYTQKQMERARSIQEMFRCLHELLNPLKTEIYLSDSLTPELIMTSSEIRLLRFKEVFDDENDSEVTYRHEIQSDYNKPQNMA